MSFLQSVLNVFLSCCHLYFIFAQHCSDAQYTTSGDDVDQLIVTTSNRLAFTKPSVPLYDTSVLVYTRGFQVHRPLIHTCLYAKCYFLDSNGIQCGGKTQVQGV